MHEAHISVFGFCNIVPPRKTVIRYVMCSLAHKIQCTMAKEYFEIE